MNLIDFLTKWGLIGTVLFLGGFMLLVINGKIIRKVCETKEET